MIPVFREMFLQVLSDFPALPNPDDLDLGRIKSFYEGIRPALKKHTKPTPKK